MKTRKTTLAALAALTLLLGLGLADDAEARIRVNATLRTPHAGVVFSNGPADCRVEPLRPLPARYYRHIEVSRRDRRIARRLASYTGVPQRELIHARRLGYSWREIGNWLGVSKRVVKAAKSALPTCGTVLFSIAGADKTQAVEAARKFAKAGFRILATEGTHKCFTANSVQSEHILKLHEGRPNIVDAIMNGDIQLVVNTPIGKTSQYDDSYIRKTAIKYNIPYITTTAAAMAAAQGVEEGQQASLTVKSVQDYHADIG